MAPDRRARCVTPHAIALVLSSGLAFDIGTDSRIEKALLLSATDHPDHVWEPQTTKLLVQLAAGASNVVVGGAYIGDHVLPMARAMGGAGTVHAFEPMTGAFERLVRNLEINGIHNVVANQLGLWDRDDVTLGLAGDLALASSGGGRHARPRRRGGNGALGVALARHGRPRARPWT